MINEETKTGLVRHWLSVNIACIVLVCGSLMGGACSYLFDEIHEETYEIDPGSDNYQALVQNCFEDDLSCEDLCLEILLNEKVYDLDDLSEPEIMECQIVTPTATHVKMIYRLR